jgi:hypothetical protein
LQDVVNQIIAERIQKGGKGEEDDETEAVIEDIEGGDDGRETEDEHDAREFTEALIDLLDRSEVLFNYPQAFITTVVRVTDSIVAKLSLKTKKMTEYATLEFLRGHAPHIPAPRPCGFVEFVRCNVMFSSHVPGLDLGDAWSRMSSTDKRHISMEIDGIMLDLRAIPRPPNTPLGGVNGDGCKDRRRYMRKSETPLNTVEEFEDFIYSPAERFPLYTGFIRNFALDKKNKKLRASSQTATCGRKIFAQSKLRMETGM